MPRHLLDVLGGEHDGAPAVRHTPRSRQPALARVEARGRLVEQHDAGSPSRPTATLTRWAGPSRAWLPARRSRPARSSEHRLAPRQPASRATRRTFSRTVRRRQRAGCCGTLPPIRPVLATVPAKEDAGRRRAAPAAFSCRRRSGPPARRPLPARRPERRHGAPFGRRNAARRRGPRPAAQSRPHDRLGGTVSVHGPDEPVLGEAHPSGAAHPGRDPDVRRQPRRLMTCPRPHGDSATVPSGPGRSCAHAPDDRPRERCWWSRR